MAKIQDKILDAFRISGNRRLTIDQIVDLTGLSRTQVAHGSYQIIQKEIGLKRAVIKGKERQGIYEYTHPVAKEDPAPAPSNPNSNIGRPLIHKVPKPGASATPVDAVTPGEYVLLKVVAKIQTGHSIAVEEETGRACKLEWL